jgi:predicted TIM-barrel fold metal-dependent hydrolase
MIIDTHFHAFPAAYLELFPEAHVTARGTGLRAFDAKDYLDTMDRYGVDMGVMSNQAGKIEHGGDRAKALQLCRAINDGFAEVVAQHPSRFMAFARLPMLDVDDCLSELRRCYEDLGLHGVVLPTNVAGEYLDSPRFEAFWAAADAAGKPLFFHPVNAPCQANWSEYSLHQKILWPTDTTLAIARVVGAGILDRHPDLKLIASHLGAMILLYLDRLNWQEGNLRCEQDPEVYFKKIFYDTAGPSRAPFIKAVYDTVGPEHVLFGSDFPHGRGGRDDQFYPMTLRAMEELDVPSHEKEKIYHGNAEALFGLGSGQPRSAASATAATSPAGPKQMPLSSATTRSPGRT